MSTLEELYFNFPKDWPPPLSIALELWHTFAATRSSSTSSSTSEEVVERVLFFLSKHKAKDHTSTWRSKREERNEKLDGGEKSVHSFLSSYKECKKEAPIKQEGESKRKEE
jgi:hypothetical protein